MYQGVKVIQAEIVPGGIIVRLADSRTLYLSRAQCEEELS